MSSLEEKMDFWKLHGLRIWTLIGAGIVFMAILQICGLIWIGVATIALTATIVFACHGIVNRLEEKRIPRLWGAVIALLLGVVIIVFLVLLVVPAVVTQSASLVSSIPTYTQQLMDVARTYLSSDNSIFTVSQANEMLTKAQEWLLSNAGTLATGITGGVVGVTTTVGNAALIIFVSIIASLWLLIDLPKISVEFRRLFNDNQQKTLDVIADSFGTAIYGWAKATFICAAVNGIVCGVVFFVAGIPYSSILGVAIAILYIIPYIGPVIAYVLCGVVGLLVSPLTCVIAIIIFAVVHGIVVNIMSPKLMASTVNVHPAVTLVAILVGEALGGILGMLLAVPVVAALQAIFVTFFEAHTGKSLYTEDGALFRKVVEKPVVPSVITDKLGHRDEEDGKDKGPNSEK